MAGFIFLMVVVLLLIGIFLLIKNDYDENKKLTRTGYRKLFIAIGILFLLTMVFVIVMESL